MNVFIHCAVLVLILVAFAVAVAAGPASGRLGPALGVAVAAVLGSSLWLGGASSMASLPSILAFSLMPLASGALVVLAMGREALPRPWRIGFVLLGGMVGFIVGIPAAVWLS